MLSPRTRARRLLHVRRVTEAPACGSRRANDVRFADCGELPQDRGDTPGRLAPAFGSLFPFVVELQSQSSSSARIWTELLL